MGGEITWECQGDGRYLFKFSVYRDCSGAVLVPNGTLRIHNYQGGSQNINFTQISSRIIAPECDFNGTPIECDPANANRGYAVEEFLLESDITRLDGVPPAAGWVVTYSEQNRNANDNIEPQTNFPLRQYGVTLRAKIFNHSATVADSCLDNSPVFREQATALLPTGYEFTYNHNASDKELDSLAYAWARPLDDLPNTQTFLEGSRPISVTYQGNYDFDNPFPDASVNANNVAATINAETGEITYTSFTTGKYVSAVSVTAYKCGERVGEIVRELQTTLEDYPNGTKNEKPFVRGPFFKNGQFIFEDTVKAGDLVDFRFAIRDIEDTMLLAGGLIDTLNRDDSIFVQATGSQFSTDFTDDLLCDNPPCATLDAPLPDSAFRLMFRRFLWQTDCNHVAVTDECVSGQNTYTFIVRAVDDYCPFPSQNVVTLSITVLGDSVIESPLINCVDVQSNGDVNLDWNTTPDPNNSFGGWLIYSATDINGPFNLIDTIKTYSQTTYTHIGAGADVQRRYYSMRSLSGCKKSVRNASRDTVSTIFVDPQFTFDCIDVNWNAVADPNPTGSNSKYRLLRDYPINGTLTLYRDTSVTAYCDTFSVCTDTVTYQVELVNNAEGCTSSSNVAGIRFDNPKPETDFSFSPADPCVNTSVQFTNLTAIAGGMVTYFWDFGDGSFSSAENPSHPYTSTGTFTVSLTASSGFGCDSTIEKDVIVDVPVADAGNPVSICPGDNATIGGTSTGRATLVYKWSPNTDLDFDDVQNPIADPSATTTYTLTVTDAGGCTDVDMVTVTVVPVPTADAGSPTSTCSSDSVTLGGSPTGPVGATYQWSNAGTLNDNTVANPRALPTGTTTYTVTVTTGLNCTATDQVTITVDPSPDVDFNTAMTCLNDMTQFTDQSTIVSGSIQSYAWDFGDGAGASNFKDPSYIYGSAGTYNVKLVVTSLQGCKDSLTKSIEISPLPDVDFTYTDTCFNSGTQFTDQTTISSGTIQSYAWDFGDGVGTSVMQNPNYVYTAAGTYNVKLVVTSGSNCKDSLTRSIEIKALPIAEAGTGDEICDGDTVQLGAAANAAYEYAWDNDPTLTDDEISNPRAFPSTNTTYTVTVTEISTGCTATDQVEVVVWPLPVVDFSFDKSCLNDQTEFTDASTVTIGGLQSWNWDFGDGVGTSTQQNPTYQYTAAGTYSVKLIVSTFLPNGSTIGCRDSITKTVEINPLPDVDFSYADTCLGDGTQFTDLSTISSGSIQSYAWDFGDGVGTSSMQNPNYSYAVSGTYNVKLVVSSGLSCKDSLTQTIEIKALPIAEAGIPTTICDRDTIQIGAADNTDYDYAWDMGMTLTDDDVSDPRAFPSATTTYTVTVTERSTGCTATDAVTITVDPVPVSDFSVSDTCFGDLTSFDGSPSGQTYLWDFGDGIGGSTAEDPTYTYGAIGVYNVKLVVTNGSNCKDSTEKTVEIKALPTADAGTPDRICETDTAQLGVASTLGYTYDWDNGGTLTDDEISNPKAFPITTTTYTVTVTETSTGCTSTDQVTITVDPLPDVDFTFMSTCLTDMTQFTDATTILIGGLRDFEWDFGDGVGTSTQQNPTYTYAAAGTYNVKLIVTSMQNCRDSITKTVEINPLPDVDFSYADTCLGDGTQFTDLSTISSGSIQSYAWDFGDGVGTSSMQNPNYTYTAIGLFNVKLVVTSGLGCKDSLTQTIEIKALPLADAGSPDRICETDTTQLGSPSNPDYDYAWDMGMTLTDDDVSDPRAFPSTTTTYTVTVTERSTGCTATDQVTITVDPLPDVDFTFTASCLNDMTQFTDATTILSGSLRDFEWDFGDGVGTSTLQNPTYQYTAAGSYNVKLIVTSMQNCRDSITKTVEINPLADVDFSYADTCLGDGTQFTDLSTISSGSIQSYAWDFGDGVGTSSMQNPSYVFATAGIYNVKLVATSLLGCKDSLTQAIEIKALPLADAGGPIVTICNRDSAQLGAPNNTLYAYAWDNSTLTLNNASISNPKAGPAVTTTYTVTVTENSTGCTATDQVTVSVNVLPTVDFSYADTCLGTGTQFTDQSNISVGTIQGYAWDFGDGIGTSIIQNPNYTYATAGLYNVKLVVTSNQGCRDSITQTIEIKDLPLADAGLPVTICNTDSAQLGAPNNISYTYAWDNTTFTLNNPNISDPKAGPSVTTTYTVTVTETSTGCTATDQVIVTVDPLPVVSFSATKVCQGAITQFTDLSTIPLPYTISNREWDFGDGMGTSTQQNPSYTYDTSGTYLVKLIITSNQGCKDSLSSNIVVDTLPLADAGADKIICELDTTTLGRLPISGESYSWDNSATLDFDDVSNPRAFPIVTTQYKVTVTNTNGCSSIDSVTVTINGAPDVEAGSDLTICDRDTITIGGAPTSATAGATYKWDNSLSLDFDTAANPRAFPSNTTIYTVTVTDAVGCTSVDFMTVNVNPLPQVDFSVDATCEGDFAAFTDESSIAVGSIQSYDWDFGDGVGTSILQNPGYQYAAPGTYSVQAKLTSTLGCIDSISKSVTINARPLADAGADQPICFGDTVELGGNPTGDIASTFSWSPAADLSSVDVQNPKAYPLSTTSYYLSVSDANGCFNFDTVEITVNPLPLIVASADDTICVAEPTQLNAIGGVVYNWEPSQWIDDPSIANPIARPLKNVEYVVFGTDANGCIESDTVSITTFNLDFAVSDTSICQGDSVLLVPIIQGDETGITYDWTPVSSLSSSAIREPKASPMFAQQYVLEIENAAGCIDKDSLTVNLFDTVGLSFEVLNSPRCFGSVLEITNTSVSTSNYTWKLDGEVVSFEREPELTIDHTIEHQLTLIGSNDNCSDSASQIIPSATFVELLDLKNVNVFTPNNDGVNDLFDPGFEGEFIGCVNFQIFDRWGAKVFDSNIGQYGWDGRTLKGTRAANGMYFYVIVIASEEIRGSVYLNR